MKPIISILFDLSILSFELPEVVSCIGELRGYLAVPSVFPFSTEWLLQFFECAPLASANTPILSVSQALFRCVFLEEALCKAVVGIDRDGCGTSKVCAVEGKQQISREHPIPEVTRYSGR